MKYFYLLLVTLLLASCNSIQIKKKSSSQLKKSNTSYSSSSSAQSSSSKSTSADIKTEKVLVYHSVVESAKTYIGTPYKSGGTNASGMDCSGLVYTSFGHQGKTIPRISRDQANAGKTIPLKSVVSGDLVFFNTNGKGISHVGIVEKVENGEVFFVHASSSKGVMISSLENSYWKPRFVKAVRVD